MSKTQKTREIVEITVLGLEKTQNLKKSFLYQKVPHSFFQTRFYLEAPALTILFYYEVVGLCCRQMSDKIAVDLSKWNRVFCRSRRQNVRDLLTTLEQYQLVRAEFLTSNLNKDKEKDIYRQNFGNNVNFLFEKYGNGTKKENLS